MSGKKEWHQYVCSMNPTLTPSQLSPHTPAGQPEPPLAAAARLLPPLPVQPLLQPAPLLLLVLQIPGEQAAAAWAQAADLLLLLAVRCLQSHLAACPPHSPLLARLLLLLLPLLALLLLLLLGSASSCS